VNVNKDSGPRKALGRGLAGLIPRAPSSHVTPAMGLRSLPIERVRPSKTQPRKHFDPTALAELSASIVEHGVLQPLVVRRVGDDYEIVAGERRWRAATQAGLHEVPALVKELTDNTALQIALIENVQRQDLDALEEAEAYHRLVKDHGLTQDQVAQAVGKSRVAITNSLRLLKLPDTVLAMLADGRLTAGHARALMTLDSDAAMQKLARDIAERSLSVRDAERLARLSKAAKPARVATKTPAEANVEERLQRSLGTKVRLKHRKGKGRLEVYFHSLDELDRLLEKLS
jgi:ParB family chromosome partitioning protein